MARLPYVNMKRADGFAIELLGRVQDRQGVLPNLHRILAQSPGVLGGILDLERKVRAGTLDATLREIAALRIARLSGNPYAIHHATADARRAGVSDRAIEEIDRCDSSDAFGPRERAVLRYATEWASAEGASEGSVAALGLQLSAGQQVDLNAAIGLAFFASRMAKAYRIELESETPAEETGAGKTGCA